MANVSIARRYARALLDAAGAHADDVRQQLESLWATLSANDELLDVMRNPAYSRTQRQGVVEGLLKASGGMHMALNNLLKLLTDRNRLGHLGDIARIYGELVDVKVGRIRGKVHSAAPLATEQLNALEKSLEALTQADVVLEAQLDPSLLGGLTAQVGGVMYDGSLRNQLNQLGRTLKAQR
ncbi:MAG: ATP synthase F1 subunit delta [Myxococcaceae bacterium]|nr:ATP synthase F1 subunit delta [Myxococcaceae bacterium]